MLSFSWLHQDLVHLLWLAVALTGLIAFFELRGQDALGRVVSRLMQHRLATRSSTARRVVRLGLIVACFGFGVLALMRPQRPGDSETISVGKTTADIMVVLDVSRSMLAEDAAPTRLDRAKAEVSSLVDKLSGHRIGLVAFAGRATVLAPLTPDYGFFRMILRGTNTKSVSKGGTRIGDALLTALRAFDPGPGSKIILLITDGEDHDSFAEDAAKEATEAGVRIISIGFGSEEGSEITLVDPETKARSVLTDKEGNVVRSRLDGELLRKLALETEGVYVPAGVAALDLESIVSGHIKPMVTASARAHIRTVPAEFYVWFVLCSLLCLFGAVWLGSTNGANGRSS